MVVSAPAKTQETSEVNVKPRKNWLKLILVCVALQIVALLFTELMLFIAGFGEEEIFAFDKDLGTQHMTNKRITWRSEGYGCTYLDANGMQEDNLTVAKPANTYRVALLGDSMVEGLQVHNKDKFSRILDKSIKLADGKQVQILNFGTSGYSTAQAYVQLKKKVLQFSPDMVILCYDSRDIFENWSPADATLSNVRPVALHLPGQKLVVNSAGIDEWMRSPRAKFLTRISWIRQNSRLWGLISAMETELSFNNTTYKTMIDLITRPKKTIKKLWEECSKPEFWDIRKLLPASSSNGPSFKIQFFAGKDLNADLAKSFPTGVKKRKGLANQRAREANRVATNGGAATEEERNTTGADIEPENRLTGAPSHRSHNGAKGKNFAELEKDTVGKVVTKAQKPIDEGARNYIALMSRTLSSLVKEMDDICKAKGVNFAVAALPARIGVVPYPGTDTTMYGLDYQGEVAIVETACQEHQIPFLDLVKPATELSPKQKKELFYSLHLAPFGHKFVADRLGPFIEQLNNKPETGSNPIGR